MAVNNQEIEIKQQLTASQFNDLKRKLSGIGEIISISRQAVDYFTPQKDSFSTKNIHTNS